MTKRFPFVLIIGLGLILTACSTQTPQTPTLSYTQSISLPSVTATEAPQPSATALPATATATSAPSVTGLPDIGQNVYLDDRSTPAALMLSYYNAINRMEYLRAFSYYADNPDNGTLDTFSQGYADTKSVSVKFGQILNEGAAGSIYYTVPMVLDATKTNGSLEKFAACYTLRWPQSANFAEPPITLMRIFKASAVLIPQNTSDADALAQACPVSDVQSGPNLTPAVVEDVSDVSATNYIDNRSDPVSVINSLLNAINRQEYVRAFSYWQTPHGDYADFAAGYKDTVSVSAQYGTVTPDAGAGQLHYSVPTVLKSVMTDGTTKTFAGCYTLHLSQPGFQATPPFEPLGITGGNFQKVSNDLDVNTLLVNACK